jgi:hypothetical protein
MKIETLKKGVEGIKLYLDNFDHRIESWRFIQKTTVSFFQSLSKCDLNFSQVWKIMEDVFCSIKIISMNNKHLELDGFIKGVINKAAQNEQ